MTDGQSDTKALLLCERLQIAVDIYSVYNYNETS